MHIIKWARWWGGKEVRSEARGFDKHQRQTVQTAGNGFTSPLRTKWTKHSYLLSISQSCVHVCMGGVEQGGGGGGGGGGETHR